MALILRFYGNSEDGDAFLNSIRTLFLSFNTLMDRPLDEGVKIKVRGRIRLDVSGSCFLFYYRTEKHLESFSSLEIKLKCSRSGSM